MKAIILIFAALPSLVLAAGENPSQVAVNIDGNVVTQPEEPGCDISSDTAGSLTFDFDDFAAGDANIVSDTKTFDVLNCGGTTIKLTTADEDPFADDNKSPSIELTAEHTAATSDPGTTPTETLLDVELSSDNTDVFTAQGQDVPTAQNNTAFEINISATITSDTSALEDGDIVGKGSQFIYFYFSDGATGSSSDNS